MKKTSFTILLTLFGLGLFAQEQPGKIYSLQECIDLAIENNLTVKRSELQKQGVKINLNEAKANRLPDLNAGGNYGYNWGRSIDPTTNQFIAQQIAFAGFSGRANVTLFNWFNITNSIKQQQLNLRSADYDVERAKNDISLNIVTFYLNVIFNKELLENAEIQLKSVQEQLDRTKKLVKSGALALTSELELVSQVATNEVNAINAKNNLDLAVLSLKQAMLIPAGEIIDFAIPDVALMEVNMSDITAQSVYERALETMPEIRGAELDMRSAEMGVKIAEAGYTPTLSLSGALSTNYSDAFQTFNSDTNEPFTYIRDANGVILTSPTFLQTNAGVPIVEQQVDFNGSFETVSFGDQLDQNLSRSLTLNLSIPIFNNLQAYSSVQRAKIAVQESNYAVEETKILLRQTIEQAYNDAFAASKVYGASTRQVEALEETFRSVQNQYNLGAANFTDFQVASNNLFGAQSDLVRAKYDYIFKTKVLDFYQGKTLTF